MLEHPRVTMAEDAAVPNRTIQVEAETADPNASSGGNSETQVLSATMAGPVAKQGQRAMLLLDTSQGPHVIPLESTLLTLGRGLNNDIILEDTRVSRHHAQLRYKTRRFWVTDLNSTNGTYVNGERISETDLRHGDVVSLGGLELTFRES
jgi:pSer/pThr/pTyr-binding forkhead associated (FHA) protein